MNFVGNLLIAPPAVKGNFWYKTVITITEHNSHGSVGVVLNKRSTLTIKDFGEQLNYDLDYPGYIYQGGPVNVKSLSFLHTNDWACRNTLRVNHLFSVSSADDILPRLAMGDCPKKWRIFLGMCGWGPGQLVSELKGIPPWNHSTSWCTASSELDLIFESDNKDQWVAALDRSGLEFAQNLLT
jgi:putative transcriptional regulator